jgi:hypothetical protein
MHVMNELIAQLVGQLGINESQAGGGAGMLFKLAKEKLGGDFSKVTGALPGVAELIQKAPAEGGASKLIGGLMGSLGGKAEGLASLASLAGGFSKLDLDPGMISKFVPVVLDFVKTKAGGDVVGLLNKVLKA